MPDNNNEVRAYISKITIPSGNSYYIKDEEARGLISELQAYSDYIGVTTSTIVDGVTSSPIVVIAGENVTARKGNIVNYEKHEYIYNGSVWQEFGDLSAIGDLGYKDTAEALYTPQGSVSQPSFTGTQAAVSVTGTPAGTIAITVGNGSTNYTPSGAVSVSVTPSTTTVNSITNVGTLPALTTTVANEELTISWSAGTLPTKGDDTSVATGISSATGTFSGTSVDLEAAFTGSELNSTGTFTPSGTVSQPSFTGTEATITVS